MKKKMYAFVAAGIIMAGTLSTTAMAGNITDRYFYFNFSNAIPDAETGGQVKEDSTSTYVKLMSLPSSYVDCQVYGLRTNGKWYNETVGGTVHMPKGEWFVKQYVKERGGSKAKLRFIKTSSNGSLSGYWSPDSVGSYPSLN